MKILFIGSCQLGETPTGGGVQVKNQNIINYLLGRDNIVLKVVDTWGKNSLFSLFLSITAILLHPSYRTVCFSISSRGVDAILRLTKLFKIKRDFHYFVAGGDMIEYLKSRPSTIKRMLQVNRIYVQGDYLVDGLEDLGLHNVQKLVNFKHILDINKPCRKESARLKLIFLGRLIEEKGIKMIIEAAQVLSDSISVDFYGVETEQYNKEFFKNLKLKNVQYKGFMKLDTSIPDSYNELLKYDALLFPSYFRGEGFPGVMIDAFIAGLPIITTNHNANAEVVQDGYNGLVMKETSSDELIKQINRLKDPLLLKELSVNARASAKQYDIKTVLSNVFTF